MPKKTMHGMATPPIFRNAHALRNKTTKAENILWEYLREKRLENIKFRRQHPIDNYVVDFYANKLKLAIELDGPYHDEKSMKFSDHDRENNLKQNGITVLRFTNDEVFASIAVVLKAIRSAIKRLEKRDMPTPDDGVLPFTDSRPVP